MSWEYWLLIVMAAIGFVGVWEHGKIINRHADEIDRRRTSFSLASWKKPPCAATKTNWRPAMCDRWYCPWNMCRDCALPSDEQCPQEEDEQECPDDLGDMMYHQKIDEELCHV